ILHPDRAAVSQLAVSRDLNDGPCDLFLLDAFVEQRAHPIQARRVKPDFFGTSVRESIPRGQGTARRQDQENQGDRNRELGRSHERHPKGISRRFGTTIPGSYVSGMRAIVRSWAMKTRP